jgi:hypothetical protein
MRIGVRQVVSWAAIYAIALRAILLGVAPVMIGGATAEDPFSIVCHSDGQALAPSEQPAAPGEKPGQPCEHCNLCSAVTAQGPLKKGDKVPVTLAFEKAGDVKVTFDIQGVGATGSSSGQMDHSMPGMQQRMKMNSDHKM